MVARMEILQYPHPLLRSTMPEVEDFDDPEFKRDAKALLARSENGLLGLAANQVGIERRMCVVKIGLKNRRPLLMVNPVLRVAPKAKLVDDFEGCASLPDLYRVVRYSQVLVSYEDLGGKSWSDRWEGMTARIAQHEIDHLNGVLILDKGVQLGRKSA